MPKWKDAPQNKQRPCGDDYYDDNNEQWLNICLLIIHWQSHSVCLVCKLWQTIQRAYTWMVFKMIRAIIFNWFSTKQNTINKKKQKNYSFCRTLTTQTLIVINCVEALMFVVRHSAHFHRHLIFWFSLFGFFAIHLAFPSIHRMKNIGSD